MAKKDQIAEKLKAVLSEGAVSLDESYRSGVALTARATLAELRAAIEACHELEFYLETITGLDFTDTLELVYHLNCYEPASRIAVRVLLGEDQKPPSMSDLYSGAVWLEREVRDFYGIEFSGSPDMRPLLMPEDADCYPLRKSFGKVHAYRKRDEIYG